MRKQPNINCIYYINDYGGRCGQNPPPDEERLFMYLTCKLTDQPGDAYCRYQIKPDKPAPPPAPPRKR